MRAVVIQLLQPCTLEAEALHKFRSSIATHLFIFTLQLPADSGATRKHLQASECSQLQWVFIAASPATTATTTEGQTPQACLGPSKLPMSITCQKHGNNRAVTCIASLCCFINQRLIRPMTTSINPSTWELLIKQIAELPQCLQKKSRFRPSGWGIFAFLIAGAALWWAYLDSEPHI